MTGEFSALLRRLRQQASLTQEALAERAGVGVRTVRRLETGRHADPRMTTVQLLADALELTPEELQQLRDAAVRTGRPDPDEPTAERDEPDGAGSERADAERGRPGSRLRDGLADVADRLARAVAARWQREEEQRQVQDPFPLPVRWRPAAEKLTDHWANIRRLPPGGAPDPLDLTGRLDEIVGVYRRISSGRLVVLGRAGSGKTILTLRFVLDHLHSREPAEPVPVIFSIGSWNPTVITLRNWLIGQLSRDHPGLAAAGPGGASLAAALVETGWVLPVLDGFDEIADGLRRSALEALNLTTLPLLLTSRPAEYVAAVAENDVLTSAAAVELADLTVDDLADYLPRTTRKAGGGRPAAWDPVLAELREHPESQASANLTAVLATPLTVALARAIYSDTPDHDPAALLDTGRFGGPEELADHLLSEFVPSVYRRRPGDPAGGVGVDRARHWLGYLADHLTRTGTPDLAWWQLGGALRRTTRSLTTAVVTGLTIGLADCVVGSFVNPVGYQLMDGLVVGLLAGLMFGVAHWLMVAARGRAVPPSTVRVRLRGRVGRIRSALVSRLVIGLACGLVFGFTYGFAVGIHNAVGWHAGVADSLDIGLEDGTIFGLLFGAGVALTAVLLSVLETPLDIGSAVSPLSLLAENRRTTTTQLFVSAIAFGLLVGFGSGLVVRLMEGLFGPLIWSTGAALMIGVLSGVGGALGFALTLTAWGQWVVVGRIWLPLTGRLPWAVTAFLDDAYRRGVLRQAGAVYQFRHARLQEQLARAYRARPSDATPR